MRNKILTLTFLFLGAFLLFYPQTSKAVSCKCTAPSSVGTIKINCQSFTTEYVGDNIKDCDQYKITIANRLNESASQLITADSMTCETFSDESCTAAEVPATDIGTTVTIDPDLPFIDSYTVDLNKKPLLEVNIPGLNFSDVASSTDENGTYFYIPWIPEMISALYKFLLAVVSIVAVVVIIIQGLRVIASGGGEGKTTAYKKIFQAIVGLFIAWGSYAILFTINPALVEFNALKVQVIQADPMDIVLTTTEVDTSAESDAGSGGGGGPSAGTHTSAFPNCPLTLPGTSNKQANKQAFYDQIRTSGKITATTPGERVVQIADISVACGMHLGNCGLTAGIFSALAMDNQNKCLSSEKLCTAYNKKTKTTYKTYCSCQDFKGTLVRGISKTQRSYLYGRRCNFENQDDPDNQKYIRSDCGKTQSEAMGLVRKLLKDGISGWPDNWIKDLRVGDYVKIFNGNKDLLGSHSLIFTGWTSKGPDGGMMQTISGSTGKPTHAGTVCVTSACGSYQPILYIFRPK